MPTAEPQKLRFGLFGGFDLNDIVRLPAVVRQKAEFRHESCDGAHQLYDAAVPVAARSKHAVGIDHRRGFRPGQDVAALWDIAHLRQVTGAGIIIFTAQAELPELLLVALLLAVHHPKDDVLKKAARNVFVQRARIGSELLPADRPGAEQFFIQVIHRRHHPDAEADNRVAKAFGHRHHAFSIKGFAVHHKGLYDLCHGFALTSIKQGLLLLRKIHAALLFRYGVIDY